MNNYYEENIVLCKELNIFSLTRTQFDRRQRNFLFRYREVGI